MNSTHDSHPLKAALSPNVADQGRRLVRRYVNAHQRWERLYDRDARRNSRSRLLGLGATDDDPAVDRARLRMHQAQRSLMRFIIYVNRWFPPIGQVIDLGLATRPAIVLDGVLWAVEPEDMGCDSSQLRLVRVNLAEAVELGGPAR